jgi:hypothetical protein
MESGTFASHGFTLIEPFPVVRGVFSAKAWVGQYFQEGRFLLQLEGVCYERPGAAFLSFF